MFPTFVAMSSTPVTRFTLIVIEIMLPNYKYLYFLVFKMLVMFCGNSHRNTFLTFICLKVDQA